MHYEILSTHKSNLDSSYPPEFLSTIGPLKVFTNEVSVCSHWSKNKMAMSWIVETDDHPFFGLNIKSFFYDEGNINHMNHIRYV